MLKKICIAYEGSDNSNRAFDFAVDMCTLCPGAALEVTVLSVVVPPEQSDVIVNVDQIIASMRSRYEKMLSALVQKAKDRSVTIHTEIMTGDAAEEILKYVRDRQFDLVIVGQKGKSLIDQFVLGSVSRRVVRYAVCAVTVVK
jgi:nucleotide-binding universal stress UspA family protein